MNLYLYSTSTVRNVHAAFQILKPGPACRYGHGRLERPVLEISRNGTLAPETVPAALYQQMPTDLGEYLQQLCYCSNQCCRQGCTCKLRELAWMPLAPGSPGISWSSCERVCLALCRQLQAIAAVAVVGWWRAPLKQLQQQPYYRARRRRWFFRSRLKVQSDRVTCCPGVAATGAASAGMLAVRSRSGSLVAADAGATRQYPHALLGIHKHLLGCCCHDVGVHIRSHSFRCIQSFKKTRTLAGRDNGHDIW